MCLGIAFFLSLKTVFCLLPTKIELVSHRDDPLRQKVVSHSYAAWDEPCQVVAIV